MRLSKSAARSLRPRFFFAKESCFAVCGPSPGRQFDTISKTHSSFVQRLADALCRSKLVARRKRLRTSTIARRLHRIVTVPASALHMGKVARAPSQHLDPETWCWLGPHFPPAVSPPDNAPHIPTCCDRHICDHRNRRRNTPVVQFRPSDSARANRRNSAFNKGVSLADAIIGYTSASRGDLVFSNPLAMKSAKTAGPAVHSSE